ncbi:MAG TPA: hypothetical protein PK055_04760 [Gammaproteobacteria bacterium]|nr:hypothetical protein [Xanthomonadales bacterium]MCB1594724.1 hypothetical protein [Xanthomonadales bacterium]HPI96489.1 hypothetical protein [Gammaproteobacteria bacterium]HPQ86947.1 hypothetical protein [Gammaproteobacteria bacterium]
MFAFLRKVFKSKKSGHYFIHIPKTAGTSFINILDNCHEFDSIFPCQLWREINQGIIDSKDHYKLIRGHFGGNTYRFLSSGNPHLLTILRHPQSLAVSTYHFIKREKNTAVHDLVTNSQMSLKEFLKHSQTSVKINNRMVRHLSFDLKDDPEAQELFLSEESIKVINQWLEPGKKIDNKDRLQRAINLLNNCSWFGIQEQFDKSMQLFAYTFNLPPNGDSPNLNAFNPKQPIDEECVNIIYQENEFDLKLYNHALQKFEEKYAQMCKKLKSEFHTESSKDINQLIDLNYRKHHKTEILESVEYDFSNKLLGGGWHRREITLPENDFFRWTQRPDSFIDFWLKPNIYVLSIRIINSISEELLENLVVTANDISLDYQFDAAIGVVRILSAQINKEMFSDNLLRIRFIQPETKRHSEIFGSNDNRRLGFAVHWIKLVPCQ